MWSTRSCTGVASWVSKEKLKVKRDRADRESELWIQGLAAVGPTPANCHWVHVADRSADTFEFLARNAAHGTEFVVLSTNERP